MYTIRIFRAGLHMGNNMTVGTKAFINNKYIKFIFDAALAVLAFYGSFRFMFYTGVFNAQTLGYYTLQSNLFVALIFSFKAALDIISFKSSDGVRYTPRLDGLCTFVIAITMIVVIVILQPMSFKMIEDGSGYKMPFYELTVHYLVPSLTVLSWILLTPHAALKPSKPLLWLLVPLCYFLLSLVAAACGASYGFGEYVSSFPYFFIDVYSLGWGQGLINIALLGVFMTALGYLIFGLDKLLGIKNRNPLKARGADRGC